MTQLDWLIVAPRHDDLDAVDAEIAAIAEHHAITPQPPLTGYVTDMDIRRAVTAHDCDVFHWLTHTAAGVLQLSDGYTVDADTLAQFCLSCKAELCIIDACVGEQLAQRVAYLCACDVIYSPVNIEDRVAAIYMAQYAAELAKLGNYHEAYQAVGSHGGQYKFIRAKDSVTRGRPTIGQLEERNAFLGNQNDLLRISVRYNGYAAVIIASVALLVTIWLGSMILDLRSQFGEMRAELHYLERTINDRSGQ